MTVTVDGLGRVQSVTVTEPRFSPEERALLMASWIESHEPRGRHGHLLSDATDPATNGKWKVPLPTLDFAQAALNKEQEKYRKAYPEADMDALLWSVQPS